MCVKQQVQTLRDQQMKDRSQIAKLKDKLDALEGKKRFDPAKAFQTHTKENDHPSQHLRLRDGKSNTVNTEHIFHLLHVFVLLTLS